MRKLTDLLTIGVYGFTEAGFFRSLVEAGVDTLCDVRRRRGVRGSEYAFANRARLEARLAEHGIRYVHRLDLAPSNEVRSAQMAADRLQKTEKRLRATLSEAFVAGYRDEVLSHLDAARLAAEFPEGCGRVAFLCVEREPDACHRSLLVEHLARSLELPVTHLHPE